MLDQHKTKRDLMGVENLSLDIQCLHEDSCVNKTDGGQKGWFNWNGFFLVTIPHDFIKCFGWDGEIEPPSVEWDNGKRANYYSFLIHDVDILWQIDAMD
jgi:hypothetical protein